MTINYRPRLRTWFSCLDASYSGKFHVNLPQQVTKHERKPKGCHLVMYSTVCLSACLPVCLPVCLSVCLSFCLSVCLSACLPACLSVCLLPCTALRKHRSRWPTALSTSLCRSSITRRPHSRTNLSSRSNTPRHSRTRVWEGSAGREEGRRGGDEGRGGGGNRVKEERVKEVKRRSIKHTQPSSSSRHGLKEEVCLVPRPPHSCCHLQYKKRGEPGNEARKK